MPDDIILRGEANLPAELARLLHEPPPDGVWYLPGHRPQAKIHRFAQLVSRLLRAFTGKARRRDGLRDDDPRFGLWLTEDYLMLVDERGPRAVRREDITRLRVHRMGRRRRDNLAFELTQGRLRLPVDLLDGWAGRAQALRAEVDRRQKDWRARDRTPAVDPALRATAAEYAASRQFGGFVLWLNGEAADRRTDAASRAALIQASEEALASWPDETRRALPGWFLAGGPADASGRRRFARDKAFWLLPLSRAVSFDAASHFPDAVSLLDCAATFRSVPLTAIEIEGELSDSRFEAVLAWAATKKLKTLAVSGANEGQCARLADFKHERGIV